MLAKFVCMLMCAACLDIVKHAGALELGVELALELLGVQTLLLRGMIGIQAAHHVAFGFHGYRARISRSLAAPVHGPC